MTLPIHGFDCHVTTWNLADPSSIKAVAIVYHGFLAHGMYPTVRYAAELLANHGYGVLAPDMRGHGKSSGQRGYIPNTQSLIDDAVAVAQHAQDQICLQDNNDDDNKRRKLFLVGSSMGGALSLAVASEASVTVDGLILLAPMLALNVSGLARGLLGFLSHIIPTVQVIPSSSTDPELQYRHADKRRECIEDELTIPGKTLRVASAATCVDLASHISNQFSTTHTPFFCLVANQDHVVDNAGSLQFHDQSPSPDKTLKQYNALHGLLCEPSPLIDEIHQDILDWINARC